MTMPLNLLRLVLFLVILNLQALHGQDDQQASAMTKMRQVLRDTMGQLRDAQNQVVTLQAAQAQSDQDKAALQAKVDALTAQLKSVGDQAVADKTALQGKVDALTSQVTDQKGQIDRLNAGLKQWKDAYGQTAQLAATSEAARKQYAIQAAVLQRTVDDREAKNLALYKLGNEILTRYEKFGLGEALEAKEPFVGLSRVKLENLVQDYKNKLLDQAVTSGDTSASSIQPANPVQAKALEPVPPGPSAAPAARPADPAPTATPSKMANAKPSTSA
jgi:chromosome segregation ATPase